MTQIKRVASINGGSMSQEIIKRLSVQTIIVSPNEVKDYFYKKYEFNFDPYNSVVLFDNETKKWLVIRNDGKGIVIYNDAHYDEIKVPNVESENIVNLKWDYDMIYIPKKDKLLLYNTISNMEKEFELKNIIDENSKIKLDKNGFEIINKNKLYKCMFK